MRNDITRLKRQKKLCIKEIHHLWIRMERFYLMNFQNEEENEEYKSL